MSIYFTADLHFGHKNIIQYDSRPFSSVDEMNSELIARWNSKVKQEDTVYILGDISWYPAVKTKEILNELNGNKILIIGNHDKVCLKPEIKGYFAEIHNSTIVSVDGQRIVLSHFPYAAWDGQYRNTIHLYAHVHNTKDEKNYQILREYCKENNIPFRAYNAGCMFYDYKPVSLKEILSANNDIG